MNDKHLQDWYQNRKNRKNLYDANDLFEKIKQSDIGALSRGITLIESTQIEDKKHANQLIRLALPFTGNSMRIGITGVPGVGKSTFIESYGIEWINQGKKVAVLAIDPTSELNHGSILADKTRMERLSIHSKAYIRPTAAGKSLGGVARNTREAILLCELAGFDVIIIETVGVGQSETQVHSMVDFFVLLMLAGAGDELQGIKRGIMEMADLLVVTKADGENINAAKVAQRSYQSALHLFPHPENNWLPKVELCSSFNEKDIKNIVDVSLTYFQKMHHQNLITLHRKKQDLYWFNESLQQLVLANFFAENIVKVEMEKVKERIKNGEISSFEGAENVYNLFIQKHGLY